MRGHCSPRHTATSSSSSRFERISIQITKLSVITRVANTCFAGGQPGTPSAGLANGWWAAWDALQDPSSHEFSSGLSQARALQVVSLLMLVLLLLPLTSLQSVLVSQMRNLMTPNTRASRKIFFAKFDATGDLALLRHPKVWHGLQR